MTGSLLSTLFISLLAQTGDHSAEPIKVPSSVMDVLQSNAAELSGLEFVTTAARRSLVREAELPEQLRFITTSDFAAMETYHVAIDKNRFHSKTNVTWMGKAQEGEQTFDGRKLYGGKPPTPDVGSILAIDTPKGRLEASSQTGFLKRHFFWEYFPEAGYHLPDSPNEYGDPPSAVIVYLIRHGRLLSWKDAPAGGLAEVVLEGPDPWAQLRMTPQQIKDSVAQLQGTSREYQAKVLDAQVENSKASPSRRYRLLLDPKMGFAVKEQWDETFSKELLLHTVCDDFEKLPNRAVWLPKTCRTLAHAHENLPAYVSAKPIYETVVTLKSVSEKEFSDKDFQLWYDSPGGDVFDYTAEGATRAKPVNYKVPGTVADLGKVSENSNAKTGMRTWILVGNAAILLLLIGFVLVSRHRRAK